MNLYIIVAAFLGLLLGITFLLEQTRRGRRLTDWLMDRVDPVSCEGCVEARAIAPAYFNLHRVRDHGEGQA